MDMSNRVLSNYQALSASLYFWWIAYLRCSKDYWWICQQRGECLDPRLVNVYRDFGDVFQYPTVMHWWLDHGVKLFDSPQIEMDFVKYLISGIEVLIGKDLVKPRPDMLCLAIPLELDSQAAMTAIFEAWSTARIRGRHYTVGAKYQLASSNKRSLAVIVPCYRTWMLNFCVTHSKTSDKIHAWGGFQMGHHLHLSPENEIQPSDSLKVTRLKQAAMRTQFSRNKTTAQALIENVEVGRFPCKEPVAEQPRWDSKQLKARDEAIRDGAWQAHDWLSHEHAFMLPDVEINAGFESSSGEDHVLEMLNDFGALATSFLNPKRVRTQIR